MGSLFSPKSERPAPVTPPREMPDDTSPMVLEAKRRAAQDIADRQGRTSTMMTKNMEGPKRGSNDREYSAKTLG